VDRHDDRHEGGGVGIGGCHRLQIDFAKGVLPTEAEIRHVLSAAASGPKTAMALIIQISAERQAFVFRGLVWMVKLGVLQVQR
jgi:hypothetical protein